MEVLIATSDVEHRIAAGEPTDKIVAAAREGGMRSLWDSGIEHVLCGETDLEELLRVIEVPMEQPTARRDDRSEPRLLSPTPRSNATPVRSATIVPAAVGTPAPPPRSGSFLPESALELVDDIIPSARRKGQHTVLLVEDEEPLRRVLRDLLERDGFTVVEAADGMAALDEIDRSSPDAVVLDLNLPRLDGYGVLARLRSRAATAHLPVIVLTAKADEDNEVRVFQSGANDFLTKPFRPRALAARLRALIQQT